MTIDQPETTPGTDEAAAGREQWLNVPNALGLLRLVFSPVLPFLAAAEWRAAFLGLYGVLLLTDWIDGKIARYWNQRTEFGARLDSVSDATMYGSLALGGWWLAGEALLAEAPLILVALGSYALSVVVSLLRFRRPPSYHTRGAKLCWLLIAVSVFTLFGFELVWPLRVTLAVLTLTNLEAVAISFVLSEWTTDVPSLVAALRHRRRTSQKEG